MARCKNCGQQIKALRSKTFCGPECYNIDRDQRAEARMIKDQQKHFDKKPMARDQALMNQFNLGQSHKSLDELIDEVFGRSVS